MLSFSSPLILSISHCFALHWTSWARPNWVILPPLVNPRRASLLTRWWNALFPPLLSSCHSFPLSSCSNLIYLPPESIIFVVSATLRESTFASQRCLTRCVLKASIHALNEAHCFSFCLKRDSFVIFSLVCMHMCIVLLLFNGLGLLALSPALCDSYHPSLI